MSRRHKVSANRHKPVSARAANPPRFLEPAALLLIVIVTFLVYSPSFHGGILWDDDLHVTKPELRSFHGLYRIWFDIGATQQYYPLLHTAFWIEHKLWGNSVLGYHLINVTLHLVSVSLVYVILRRLKVPGALLATAIFALHPVMVESVAWIAEQKNTLSLALYLAAVLMYLNFDDSRRPSDYVAALGLFVLALLAKTSTVMLPPMLLVILWWRRGMLSWRRDVRPLIPFFVLSAAASILTSWVERSLIGAEYIDFAFSYVDRFLVAGRAVWFYLLKLLWPVNLIPVYPRWQVDPAVWWQWLFPVAAISVLGALWAIRNKSRGPLAGWLYFCGTLFPLLGFFNVAFFEFSFVSDHFQYLPSLGIIVLLSAGIALALARMPIAARWVGGTLCVILVGTLAALTMRQNRVYADPISFYRTTLERNPDSWMTYRNLGLELTRAGRVTEAVDSFQFALALKPKFPLALNDLGCALALLNRFPEAIDCLHQALLLDPNLRGARANLGNYLINAGRLQEAVDELKAALANSPDDPAVLFNLGYAYYHMHRYSEAIENFEHALLLKPKDLNVYANIAQTLALMDRPKEAVLTAEEGRRIARATYQENFVKHFEDWLAHYQLGSNGAITEEKGQLKPSEKR